MTDTAFDVLTVDVATELKLADQAASGSLYGLDSPSSPKPDLVAPLRPKNFTQKAPGGFQRPGGDALMVAATAAAFGGSVTIRLADFFPDFPYRWRGVQEWLAILSDCVRTTRESQPPNIYAYEIWNEPNWTWSEDAPPFLDIWTRSALLIRDLDPARRIMGPSIERWDGAWMEEFLRHAQRTQTLPDVTSWHVLDPGSADDVADQLREYRELETKLGIDPRPISINEYGAIRDVGAPGPLVRFIAAFERGRVDTANLAFWHREGRLADLVTADDRPTSAWWLFEWYGQLDGTMLYTTSGSDSSAPDGFACRQADGSIHVVVGEQTRWVRVRGLHGKFEVECRTIEWTGPDGHSEGSFVRYTTVQAASDGVVEVLIPPSIGPCAASRLVLRPSVARASAFWSANGSTTDAYPSWPSVQISSGVPLELPVCGQGPALVRLVLDASARGAVTAATAAGVVTELDLQAGVQDVVFPIAERNGAVRLIADSSLTVLFAEVQPWRTRLAAADSNLRFSGLVRVDMRLNAYSAHRFHQDAFISDGPFDSLGSSATWEFDAPRSGLYRATIAYANGGPEVLLWVISADQRYPIHVPPTQGWGVVGSVELDLVVTEGRQALTLNADRRGGRLEYNYVEMTWLDDPS